MGEGPFLNISFEPQLINPAHVVIISKGNIFLKSFEQYGGQGLSFRPFSIKKPAPITQYSTMASFQCLIFLKE